ncbi:MAG: hypothetical protein M3464_21755 [Chloroflexota bacterium]|nr:hypothetical protein [Chloroflexota bacterium]
MTARTLPSQPWKLMYYCHDTYGLGHLRRTLTLAGHLRRRERGASQLIVTGSPVASSFPYPTGADYVKLPSVIKTGADQYEGRTMATAFGVVRDMRQDILLSAARHFKPDVFIVDHAPGGLAGEAIATLRHLKEQVPAAKLVVGLRDVIDEQSRVRAAWTKEGVYELLDDIYDMILVYGRRDLYDVVGEYGLSPRAAAKTRYVGYLRRAAGLRSPAEVRASLPLKTDRLVVVTAGGGGDGKELFQTTLAALRDRSRPASFDCLLVGGPLMPEADQAELREMTNGWAKLHFLDFAEDMTSYIAAADAVVTMGGYNTICEVLSLRRPAIVVPRVTPRTEQLIRAEALSRRGLIRMLHPDDLTPARLLEELDALLAAPAARRWLPMDGLTGVAREVGQLLRREPTPTRVYSNVWAATAPAHMAAAI